MPPKLRADCTTRTLFRLPVQRPEQQVLHERLGVGGVVAEDAPGFSAEQAAGEVEGREQDDALAGTEELRDGVARGAALEREAAQPRLAEVVHPRGAGGQQRVVVRQRV